MSQPPHIQSSDLESTAPGSDASDTTHSNEKVAVGDKSTHDHNVAVKAVSTSPRKTSLWGQLVHWALDRDPSVWWMSLGFMLLFGVQTIRFPQTGPYILIVLYSFYFATSMWATFFLSWWGIEFCLIMGPISYGTWIACMFAGNSVANLVGAGFFGWGAGLEAGLLWPAAGQLIATVSSPHNRASNAGIYQCAFHLGVWTGGLVLGAVQKSFTNYNDQYAVFIALCGTSVICFALHAIWFRRRFRGKKGRTGTDETGASGEVLHRVLLDDGTVEYRKTDKKGFVTEDSVVQDAALEGGSPGGFTWKSIKANFLNPIKMLWHPVYGPIGPSVFVTGGMTQGWFNASFNLIVYKVGGEWNGWIYTISESWALVAAIAFGLFYDRLRSNYIAERYRWVMYVYVVCFYIMCGLALATYYLGERGIGHEPGQTSPAAYKAILSFTGAFYNLQLLALEVSTLTYLTTFLTYSADVAFSAKIGCEAAGYLLVFGLVNVLSPKWMIVVLFCVGPPCHLVYLFGWWAPERPVAQVKEVTSEQSSVVDA